MDDAPPQQQVLPLLPDDDEEEGGGIVFGMSSGLGASSLHPNISECFSCVRSEDSWSIEFHLGGMLSSRLALVGEIQSIIQTRLRSAGGIAQNGVMVVAQYWPMRHFWIKSGIGFSYLGYTHQSMYDFISTPIARGRSLLVGVGYELVSESGVAIDVQSRYVLSEYNEETGDTTSLAFGIGLNWY